jgi:proton-dependent oligopeptide transporter, POT family
VDSENPQAPPADTAIRAGEPPAKFEQTGIRAGVPPAQGHPPAIWFFFWGEFSERASYYGMRAILPLYLAAILGSDTSGGTVYYWFKMACYFLPLVGGILADRYFGKYWTIVGFSVPYVLGHFILGLENQVAVFLALALLAGGSGVIKPNISTLLGQTYDQKRPGQEGLRSSAFLWFYLSINIGAFLSTLIMPILRVDYGYSVAFQFPAWLMVAALVVFALGKPYYAVETPQPPQQKTPEERRQQWETLRRLFGVFGIIIFWWVVYEHNDSIWVFFARDYVDRSLPFTSYVVPPEQIQTLNPLLVVILVPIFAVLFKRLDPQGRVFTPTRKILMGFGMTVVCTGLMALAGYLSSAETKVSIWWMALAYIILTIGEVLLYPTALEMAYAVAPKNIKSFITACFLLTNTLGNFINSGLVQFYGGSLVDPPDRRGPMPAGDFFALSTAIVLAAMVAFYFVGKKFDRQMTSAGPAAA